MILEKQEKSSFLPFHYFLIDRMFILIFLRNIRYIYINEYKLKRRRKSTFHAVKLEDLNSSNLSKTLIRKSFYFVQKK